jgi:protein-tyrosine-phosphatase
MIAAMTASEPTRYVLFVCNHNAGRSQLIAAHVDTGARS